MREPTKLFITCRARSPSISGCKRFFFLLCLNNNKSNNNCLPYARLSCTQYKWCTIKIWHARLFKTKCPLACLLSLSLSLGLCHAVSPSELFVPCQQIVPTYSNIVVLYSETNCARRSKDGRQPYLVRDKGRERERERLTFELHESSTPLCSFSYSIRLSPIPFGFRLLLSVSWPSSSMLSYFYTLSVFIGYLQNYIYYFCCLLRAAYLIFNLLSFMIIPIRYFWQFALHQNSQIGYYFYLCWANVCVVRPLCHECHAEPFWFPSCMKFQSHRKFVNNYYYYYYFRHR